MTRVYSITIYYKDKKSQKKPKHKVKIWSINKDDIYDLVDKIKHNQTTDLGINNDLITYFVLGKDYLPIPNDIKEFYAKVIKWWELCEHE